MLNWLLLIAQTGELSEWSAVGRDLGVVGVVLIGFYLFVKGTIHSDSELEAYRERLAESLAREAHLSDQLEQLVNQQNTRVMPAVNDSIHAMQAAARHLEKSNESMAKVEVTLNRVEVILSQLDRLQR